MIKKLDIFELSEDEITFFVKRVLFWKEQFKMGEWDVYVQIVNDKDFKLQDTMTLASTFADPTAGSAQINLHRMWPIEPTNEELNKTANHEILELLLIGLSTMSLEVYNTKTVIREKHKIINQLQNILIC